mgnify:CR=1 FL=1
MLSTLRHDATVSGAPPLDRSPWVTGPQDRLIKIVLHGKPGTAMAPFKHLSDVEIAAVVTYTRNNWTNKTGDMATPAEVKACAEFLDAEWRLLKRKRKLRTNVRISYTPTGGIEITSTAYHHRFDRAWRKLNGFAAGRSLEDCEKDKLAGMELVRLSENSEAKSVTATTAVAATPSDAVIESLDDRYWRNRVWAEANERFRARLLHAGFGEIAVRFHVVDLPAQHVAAIGGGINDNRTDHDFVKARHG